MVRNIAGYKFATLTDLKERRTRLLMICKGLKGTILLSTEGINLFVAGEGERVDALVAELRSWPGLEGLEVKASESEQQPFNRMLIRIKKEIIAFGVPGIDPACHPTPKLAPKILKQWLDEGRPVTLLDTRNDYEVKLGTFQNALTMGIDHFRDFPGAVRNLPPELKTQPVVMFCTGGIRCEKAGPLMEGEGFQKIFQLEGGILKYFEECGGAHYEGECFVFDQRVGVDPQLRETDSVQCFHCLAPLTQQEQRDYRYVTGQSCSYCFKTTEQQASENLRRRHESIRHATSPLPGSEPYDNFRPISVPAECAGLTLLDFLAAVIPHVSRAEWDQWSGQGLLLNPSYQAVGSSHRVRAGERYFRKLPAMIEPDVNGAITILHEDEALIVLNKPAPLPMHAGGRYNRNTLQHILNKVYYPQKPRPAHRLDANTTGIVLVTRTRRFAARLQPQFECGEVQKFYWARVQGQPREDTFSCDAPISISPGEAGSREIDLIAGLSARTEFRVLQRRPDGTTLLEAQPITGRTNQIRIHLWQMGFPICGDPTYLNHDKLGDTQTLGLNDPPLCLHASRIAFAHPLTGQRREFSAPPPPWFAAMSAQTARENG